MIMSSYSGESDSGTEKTEGPMNHKGGVNFVEGHRILLESADPVVAKGRINQL